MYPKQEERCDFTKGKLRPDKGEKLYPELHKLLMGGFQASL